ncbi:MAG: GNAT family N-acetyltransferase [Burkholderiales bacterium]
MPGFLAHAKDLPLDVTVRAYTDADHDVVAAVYASTREDEMKLATAWSDAQKRDFLHGQFALQDRHYRLHYPSAEHAVIEQRAQPIGRLVVNAGNSEVRLMDVALLPAFRGRGVGTAILHRLLAFADGLGIPVTLHVEPFNPARRMYLREGFAFVETRGIYEFMRRPPQGQLNTAS